jgi:hypothetical protein
MTPDDDMAFVGAPPPNAPDGVAHISCCFSWDIPEAERLASLWSQRGPVEIGGPALSSPAAEFVAGRYVKRGISISSRGCPNQCQWCHVPEREGALRELAICPGNVIQDNNVLAFSKPHFRRLCGMLARQTGVRFLGGLEARRLRSWHAEQLERIPARHIREMWFAADTAGALPALRRARDLLRDRFSYLADNGRRKFRAYVLIGWQGETLEAARRRLENVWDAGFLPFAQLYKDKDGQPDYGREWRALAREWSRPAAMYANHMTDSEGHSEAAVQGRERRP